RNTHFILYFNSGLLPDTLSPCQCISSKMDDLDSPYAGAHRHPHGPNDARPTALQVIEDENLTQAFPELVILITGCSSGIGVETARALASTGATLYLTARDLSKARTALGPELVSNPKVHILE